MDTEHAAPFRRRLQRKRRYPEEDTTPTTTRELRGWYSYGIAAEVFAVVGVGSFLPLTLEQLARENGVLYSDRSTPCVQFSGASNTSTPATTALAAREAQRDANQCLVHAYGFEITTASFAMYTFSAAVFIQALVMISFSSFADHGDNRKRLLLTFGFLGSITSMAFMFVSPSIYFVAPFLVILAVTCMGSSFVLLNSFLPLLAANHPEVISERANDRPVSPSPGYPPDKLTNAGVVELQKSSTISTLGVGAGYTAAVLVQVLGIGILVVMKKLSSPDKTTSNTLPLRLVLLLAGVWWFIFTIPALLWLRKRPGPPLTTSATAKETTAPTGFGSGLRKSLAYVLFAWTSLWQTIKIAVQLRQAAIFLIAWFLLSDAVATVSGTAVLFARTELHMGTVPIALLSITVMISGIAGTFIWHSISHRLKWPANRTIVACMLLMEIVPFYGLLGYLPFVQTWGVGGLQRAWEIYPLGIVHGIVMGGLSSYCRSFFGQLIPPGHEVAFYALFAITDKGSSAIGPAIVGRIVDVTGQIRPAFFFLAILIGLPIPLVWYVDAGVGQEDAVNMSTRLGTMAKVATVDGFSSEDMELRGSFDDDNHDDDDDDRLEEGAGLMGHAR